MSKEMNENKEQRGDRQGQERRLHFRGRARAGRRVELEYQLLTSSQDAAGDDPVVVDEPIRAITSNIGVGGAFVLTPVPLPVGSKLVVRISIPKAEQPIETDATVRWIISPEAADDLHEVGMGIKFYPLDVAARLVLSDYFASLTRADSSAEPTL